jgi:hypothetical protein
MQSDTYETYGLSESSETSRRLRRLQKFKIPKAAAGSCKNAQAPRTAQSSQVPETILVTTSSQTETQETHSALHKVKYFAYNNLKDIGNDRETEKDGETSRNRDRETERHRDREQKRDRGTERQRGRETEERQRDRETERHRKKNKTHLIEQNNDLLKEKTNIETYRQK